MKNLPRNYDAEFYISKLSQIDDAFDSEFNRNHISKIRSNDDAQIYLLASREVVQHMQEDIDLLVTQGKLSNSEGSKNLDPLYKNIL